MWPPQAEQAELSSRSHGLLGSLQPHRGAGHHRGALDRPRRGDRMHRRAGAAGRDARRLRRARPRHGDPRARRLASPPSRRPHRRDPARRRLGLRARRRRRRHALAARSGPRLPGRPGGGGAHRAHRGDLRLRPAPGSKANRWPSADDAYRACAAAGTEVAEGSAGAGTGATVGKALGPRRAMKGGVGTWAVRGGDVVVGALVVLNAVGNVLDGRGQILAVARGPDGKLADALQYLAAGGAPFGALSRQEDDGAGRNTTLAGVATNAALERVGLESLAHAAGDALARRIVPYGTMFDGDVVFAVSTATLAPATPLQVEALAALAVPVAVERAVRLARGVGDIPGLADGARDAGA